MNESYAKKDELGLKKLQEIKYKTYMSSPEIVDMERNESKYRNLNTITYCDKDITDEEKYRNAWNKLLQQPQLTNSKIHDIKYDPLTEKDFSCKYGMNCKKMASGQCKFKHSNYKESLGNICKRGANCPFFQRGACAFIHLKT